MMELWRPVVGFEGFYDVSNVGRVRSVDRVLTHGRRRRGALLSLKKTKSGHINVRLCYGGVHIWKWVHRLVLEAFVGPCPEGWQCCHNNGKADDNRLVNLRWDTRAANEADKVEHGTIMKGEANGMARLDEPTVVEIRMLHRQGLTGRALAARFNVTETNISFIINRKTWSHVK